ncbi:hypothetical protein QBC44DRAFT_72320 [Cladorrhinum sp. PSN332]|nr:hypothetical protein QBC44DRAFT_72320 [Cladorrhinum sp. PSN332]
MNDRTSSNDESSVLSGLSAYTMAQESSFGSLASRSPDHTSACFTPLPDPDTDETALLAEPRTVVEEKEEQESIFGSEPLEVIEGIALTEEGVESGTADIMAPTASGHALFSILTSS